VHTSEGRPDWRQIESSDYGTYIRNLRAIGCPEQTIRDIIMADVNELYNERKAALYLAAKGPFSFWATDNHTQLAATHSAELAANLSKLDREKHSFLEQLIGTDVGGDPVTALEQQIERQRRLAFLPEAKQNQVRALDQRYPEIDQQIHALVDVRSSITDPEELQRLLSRYSQKQAELSQLLSPKEYEQYELSISWTADNLRRRLAGFEPTEEEFRTIFQLWRAHDEALATVYASSQPEPGNLEVYEAIKQFLGPERNAQYRQAWGSQPVPAAAGSAACPAAVPQSHP